MNIIRIILMAICVAALASCSKSSGSNNNNGNNTSVLNYTINGVQDITVISDTDFYYAINLAYISGPQENATISLSGLPSGITLSPTTLSGIPTFTGTCKFTLVNVAPGTYPITISVTSNTSGTKTFKFNLFVIANPNCAPQVTGTYNAIRTPGGSSGVSFTSTITSTSINSINFSSIDNVSGPIDATITCADDSILIPLQGIYSTWKIYGTGHFSGNTIVLHFRSIYHGSSVNDTTVCTTTMSR